MGRMQGGEKEREGETWKQRRKLIINLLSLSYDGTRCQGGQGPENGGTGLVRDPRVRGGGVGENVRKIERVRRGSIEER